MQINLIYSKLVFFKKILIKLTHTKKKKFNNASELHCSHEQCNSPARYTVYANRTVQ